MTSRYFHAKEIRTAVEQSANEGLKSLLTKAGYAVDACVVENLVFTKTADYNPIVIDFEIRAVLSELPNDDKSHGLIGKMRSMNLEEKAELFCDEFSHGGCSVSDFERIKEYLSAFAESEKSDSGD